MNPTSITVEAFVEAPLATVWTYWNTPQHIMQWNAASDDWHTPFAENDLRVGGRSKARMEAKDGSFGFDFEWTYTSVIPHEQLAYTLDDDRKVTVLFQQQDGGVLVTETFDAENIHPVEMQRQGWQAILNNFKRYTEANLNT